MMNFLYTLCIFPIEQIIELSYIVVLRIFHNPALSVLGVSFAVSVLTLPLYFMAEKHQGSERDIQKKMKPEVDNIKAVFSGDERFMRLAAYYRQNGYHPLYSLRSSISLIIQIPFFIAAYHFLANLELIKGISFGPIADLAKPDSLIVIKNVHINILPIAMTLINYAAAFIYVKGFSGKEKIQLYGMAAIFLILLYNSPAGMVLYWTGNNLFSLVKNAIQKAKSPKKIVLILAAVLCFFLDVYLLFFHKGWIIKRIGFAFIFALVPLLPFLFKFVSKIKKPLFLNSLNRGDDQNFGIFLLSLFSLFLLGGLVVPSSLIASSVQEFSFIEKYDSPFPFIFNTAVQSAGIFLLWPVCVYCIFPQGIKRKLEKIAAVIAAVAVIDVFLFPGKYGILSLMFTFSESTASSMTGNLLNLFVILIGIILVLLLIYRFRKIMVSVLIITGCAFVLMSVINCVTISKDYRSFQLQLEKDKPVTGGPVYQFSRNGKNVLVILLDKAISGFIPYIFEEKPELHHSFDGFTWYKNAISFGPHTIFGTPGIYGGYEYTHLEMYARKDTSLIQKHNESLLLLPRIFLDQGFKVSVTDPPLANYKTVGDLSIFDDYPQVRAENIIGKYNAWWFDMTGVTTIDTDEMIESHLIRFSFFKFAPLLFRDFVYDKGKWLSVTAGYIDKLTLNTFVSLDLASNITSITDDPVNTYNTLYNDLPHRPFILRVPDYYPSNKMTTSRGKSPFVNDLSYYHVNVASMLLLGKWFDFLKENGVYDNSRIIIVSDHGYGYLEDKNIETEIKLPNGESLAYYAALLMAKDFNAHGTLAVDDSFMTNADVPLMALDGIVEKPVNPWTGKELTSDKTNGVTITTSHFWWWDRQPEKWFDIKSDEWLHIHDNILKPENWIRVKYQESYKNPQK